MLASATEKGGGHCCTQLGRVKAICCSKPVWIYFFCWTLKKIFWRMSLTRQLMSPIDFHCMGKMQKAQQSLYLFSVWSPRCQWETMRRQKRWSLWFVLAMSWFFKRGKISEGSNCMLTNTVRQIEELKENVKEKRDICTLSLA